MTRGSVHLQPKPKPKAPSIPSWATGEQTAELLNLISFGQRKLTNTTLQQVQPSSTMIPLTKMFSNHNHNIKVVSSVSNVINHFGSAQPQAAAKDSQQVQTTVWSSAAAEEQGSIRQLRLTWALSCFTEGVPFSLMKSPYLEDWNEVAKSAGLSQFSFPTPEELTGPILDEVYEDSLREMSEDISEAVKGQTGRWSSPPRPLALVTDVREDDEEHLVNFMLVDAVKGREFYLDSVRIQTPTAQSLFEMTCRVIDELEQKYSQTDHPLKLYGMITDNDADMEACGRLLEEKYPCFWTIPCQYHALDVVTGSWFNLGFIKPVVDTAADVASFVWEHDTVLEIFREINKSLGQRKELKTPSASYRQRSMFMVLKRLLDCRVAVTDLFRSAEYQDWISSPSRAAVRAEAERYEKAVESEDFWVKINCLQKLLRPVFLAARHLDQTGPSMGEVWHTWKLLKSTARSVTGLSSRQREIIMDILEAREREYMSSCELFGAAAALHPYLRTEAVREQPERIEGDLRTVARKFYPEPEEFEQFMKEYMEYVDRKGVFESEVVGSMWDSRWTCDPSNASLFWGSCPLLDTGAPSLWRFACTVLGLPASNTAAEHSHARNRNKLPENRMHKLVHVYHNFGRGRRKCAMSVEEMLLEKAKKAKAALAFFACGTEKEGEELETGSEDDEVEYGITA